MKNFEKDIKKILSGKAIFSIPGHKGRCSFDCAADTTETRFTDNLYCPEGIIKEAQDTVSEIYGCSNSFFITGGATAGIYAMVCACLSKGDKVIVDRGCHKSVFNIGMLLGLEYVYAEPDYIREFEIYGGVSETSLSDLIEQNKDAKAVILTSPNYYGIASDVRAIADLVHQHKMLLLVDAAHGSHFNFSNLFPESAVRAGADCVVHSFHKTLPALTQAACLHIADSVDSSDIINSLSVFQTTSPSYLIMSSICSAVDYMSRYGEDRLEALVRLCNDLRGKFDSTGKVCCLSGEDVDLSRLVLNFSRIDTLASQIESRMKKVIPEVSAGNNMILIPSVKSTAKDFYVLKKELLLILEDFAPNVKPIFRTAPEPLKTEMSLGEVFNSKCEFVSSKEAVGRIAGRFMTVLPPCTTMFPPGTLIARDLGTDVCVVAE